MMAKKEKTPEEQHLEDMKKAYSNLVELNQRLKSISSIYYIDKGGVIYMKTLVEFTEVIVHLHPSLDIKPFYGCMILPNKLFEFKKVAKKTKLQFDESEPDKIIIRDTDADKELVIDKVNLHMDDPEGSKAFIDTRIKPEMYKRFFEMEEDESYIQFNDKNNFVPLREAEIEDLVNSKTLFFQVRTHGVILMTRHLMLDIKKDDNVAIAARCYQPIDDTSNRTFYMIRHDTDMYTSYTIFCCLTT